MEPKFPLGRAEMNWERPHRISLVDGQYLFGVVCGTEGGDGVWRGEKDSGFGESAMMRLGLGLERLIQISGRD
jgi:hypothetical protein